jgi:hypothetical protein
MTADAHASMQRAARLAGGLHLSLVPFGVFSFVYVPAVLMVRGDADATTRNIMASEWLFRSGTVSHLVSQAIVPFLALALYRLFAQVNHDPGQESRPDDERVGDGRRRADRRGGLPGGFGSALVVPGPRDDQPVHVSG